MKGNVGTVLTAAGTGAALAYFLDPVQGRRRRAGMRDKAVWLSHQAGKFVDKAACDIGNRLHGAGSAAKAVFICEPVEDEVLVERVRARLGRLTSHPSAIHVEAEQGRIHLSGPVLKRERQCVVSGVGKVPGVQNVIDRL